MANSVYSSTKKPVEKSACFECSASQCSEESGWTAYLEDPYLTEEESFGNSSLVSDAASHAAAWKLSNAAAAHDFIKIPNKLNFKPKPTQFFIDTSLEDTASSPDNSPKVAELGPFNSNHNYQRRTNDYISSSLGKGRSIMEENYRREERNKEMGFERKANGYSDLKERGLCLVPLSMFANANYMG